MNDRGTHLLVELLTEAFDRRIDSISGGLLTREEAGLVKAELMSAISEALAKLKQETAPQPTDDPIADLIVRFPFLVDVKDQVVAFVNEAASQTDDLTREAEAIGTDLANDLAKLTESTSKRLADDLSRVRQAGGILGEALIQAARTVSGQDR